MAIQGVEAKSDSTIAERLGFGMLFQLLIELIVRLKKGFGIFGRMGRKMTAAKTC